MGLSDKPSKLKITRVGIYSDAGEIVEIGLIGQPHSLFLSVCLLSVVLFLLPEDFFVSDRIQRRSQPLPCVRVGKPESS